MLHWKGDFEEGLEGRKIGGSLPVIGEGVSEIRGSKGEAAELFERYCGLKGTH